MLENYIKYLKFLDLKLNKFFSRQKPYIRCTKGCALCCKNAEYPYSEIEIQYIMQGAWQLDVQSRKLILKNIKEIRFKNLNFKGETFKYDCPFLINKECSVYEYRGIVCRAFGLINIGADGRFKVPFCCFQGYNYANVMEAGGNNIISEEKFKKPQSNG